MTAEWRPDPFKRAHWRYFDGTQWTHHVATNGEHTVESDDLPLRMPPPSPAPMMTAPDPSTLVAATQPYPLYPAWAYAPQRKGGRLIAAGVLGIVNGLGGVGEAIVYFSLRSLPPCYTAAPGVTCSSTVINTSALTTTLIALSIAISVATVIAGIGGCMRHYWGQVGLVITTAVGIILDIVAAFNGAPYLVGGVLFSAVAIGLALANQRSDYELPKPEKRYP